MKLTILILAVVLVLVLPIAYLWVINPFDWFVPQSSNFDPEKFGEITVGDDIGPWIQTLGMPPLKRDFHSRACESCVAYHFSGPPPEWLVGATKAWVVVDSEGTIVDKWMFREP